MESIEILLAQIAKTSDAPEKLRLCIAAAQKCLQASKTASPPEQAGLRRQAQTLISQAEQLKRQTSKSPSTTTINTESLTKALPALIEKNQPPSYDLLTLSGPAQSRRLPVSEQKILWLSSRVNGHTFPPWTRMPELLDFTLSDQSGPFHEGYDLGLSKHQRENFDKWARPEDAVPPPSWFPDRKGITPTMKSAQNVDLVQDTALDCSVVASLCAGASRSEKGFQSMLSRVIFPFDLQNKCPAISPNGRYLYRFNFNGCFRAVEIDDRLPVSKSKRLLHTVDRNNPRLLWPALLEKAYLKVRGGYDFPGSNSNTDIWIMGGWIPEIVFLEQSNPAALWKRIKGAFDNGDVLITVGTGRMSKDAEQELGLVGQHNYAILDLKEQDDREMVLVKNPWCESTLWANSELIINPANETLPLAPLKAKERPLSRLPPSGNELAPGTFWMTLSDVFQNFDSIYLNWNPDMFSNRQDIHFQWDLATAHRASNSLAHNPQFSLAVTQKCTVWLLLCRHFRTDSKGHKNRSHRIADQDLENDNGEMTGHVSLMIFSNEGKRVYDEVGAIEQAPYVDSMQTLLRLQIPDKTKYTIAVAEQYLAAETHNFTLIAWSTAPAVLEHVEEKYAYSTSVNYEWNSFNSGGSTNSPAFSINPQYRLEVYQSTAIAILLESCSTDRSVNVKLCYGHGRRLFHITRQDIILDTYEYRKGSSFIHTKGELIEPGKYTVIVSTYEAGQTGKFGIRLDSNTKVKLERIPSEAHGKLNLQLPTAIFLGQASQIALHLVPLRLSNITIIVKSASVDSLNALSKKPGIAPRVRSPVRVSLQLGRGPHATELAASNHGEFSDATDVGLRISDMHITQELNHHGNLFLVIDRMGKGITGIEERYTVEILMADVDSTAIEAGTWQTWED